MILAPTTAKLPGQPVTIQLQVADTNLTGAKIVWEGLGQDPAFGGLSHTFTPTMQEGPAWVEAEIQWPDGRRAFATNSVIISTNAPPWLSLPSASDTGYSFMLTGAPLGTYVIQASSNLFDWQSISTNVVPVNGLLPIGDSATFPRRYYRAVKTP
jgi:hypothetical protein